jgi:hypothetical protein
MVMCEPIHHRSFSFVISLIPIILTVWVGRYLRVTDSGREKVAKVPSNFEFPDLKQRATYCKRGRITPST